MVHSVEDCTYAAGRQPGLVVNADLAALLINIEPSLEKGLNNA